MRDLVTASLALALLTTGSTSVRAQILVIPPPEYTFRAMALGADELLQIGVLNESGRQAKERPCRRVEGAVRLFRYVIADDRAVVEAPEFLGSFDFVLDPRELAAFTLPVDEDNGPNADSRPLLIFVTPRIVVEKASQRRCLSASFAAVSETGVRELNPSLR